MKKMRRLLSASLVSGMVMMLAILPAFLSPAAAAIRDPLKVTGDAPMMEKKYPALTGNSSPSRGTGTVNPKSCGEIDVKYCDLIRIDIDPQDVFVLYSVFLTVSWPNAKTSSNATGTDISVGIWAYPPAEPDPTVGRQSRTEGAFDHPEVVKFSTDEPEPITFLIIVEAVNQTAPMTPGTQYTVKAEIIPLDLGEIPQGRRPGSRLGGGPTVSSSPRARPASPTLFGGTSDSGGVPEPTPSTIKVPGPDGELVDQTLGVLVRGEEAQRRGVSPVVPIVIAIVLLGGATAAFFFIRSRRQGQTEASTSDW